MRNLYCEIRVIVMQLISQRTDNYAARFAKGSTTIQPALEMVVNDAVIFIGGKKSEDKTAQ